MRILGERQGLLELGDFVRRGRVLLFGLVVVGLVSLAGCGTTSAPSPAATSGSAASGAAGGSGAAGTVGGSATTSAGCQQVGSVNFDKTKFVLHAGLAFGAFHHFIYNPYKAGRLHGAAALAKAGLAGLFTVHELKLAKADAESSPTLCHLVAPFDKAATAISGSTGALKSGGASGSTIDGLNQDVNAVQSGAAADGVPAPDQVPSNTQLVSGGK